MADFVGRNLSEETIQIIAKHCSFDEMKNNTMVNRESLPVKDLFDMSETKFMRKGIIGDWKNHFNEQQSLLFDKTYNDRLKSLGLTLSYDTEDAKHRMQAYGRIIDQNMDKEINGNDLYPNKETNDSNDDQLWDEKL